MFKHLERFLMVKFPVPKRTFDMWVNVLEHAVKILFVSIPPYIWLSEAVWYKTLFNGMLMFTIMWLMHFSAHKLIENEQKFTYHQSNQ